MRASEGQQGLRPRMTASTRVVIHDNAEQEDLDHLDNIRDTLNTLNTLIMMMTHLYLIKHKPEIQ